MTRNVGAGSRSQLLAAEALMIMDISSGRQISNESRFLSVRVKIGGGADAVADRMVSTFNSRNDRNSAGLKGSDVDLPRTVETVRHSFLESDFWSLTVRSLTYLLNYFPPHILEYCPFRLQTMQFHVTI